MAKVYPVFPAAQEPEMLTRKRAEKLAAIEGLHLAGYMAEILRQTSGLPPEERRRQVLAAIKRRHVE